ncbi:MAG: methyltransferase domain-containing protein [Theionarchaea archaeon]|nr:methyltransferase domain-containing protein [Theionarchaea archaeon]MBU7001308.1 methyltransferase domain-containing protein [Theionarchaea archaeon]MBU7019799.1 methyltransferase domain-containing protein [Theionarchaea archaeon]MBU7035571.1 methyltransferase domain-containing protein [Theionarchaea archaeon]MBU7041215.1 methyltransferase domain-containing protein [Theionarchaea archaeon]
MGVGKGFIDKVLGDVFHPGGLKLTSELAQLAGIDRDTDVLVLACEEGDSAIFLAQETGAKVYAVDISPEKIREGTKKARKLRLLKRVFFKNASAYDMPFLEDMFDVVLCEMTICLFPDRLNVLKEVYRVLRPHGTTVFSGVIIHDIPKETERKFRELTCLFSSPSIPEYVELFQKAGFKSVKGIDRSEIAEEQYDKLKKKWSKLRFFSKIFLQDTIVDEKEFTDLIKEGERLIEEKKVGYAIFIGKK